ncbi:ABC transporter permease [Aliagarivorans taiwanensis]|uniref:ABC transporter permease n=1 Tax=Aliagarivorans taiwanensis TaxID=561966 RepID=UPI0003F7E17B|nr:ABC transporter permease [Aliagarivorans taiwanensis]
MFVFLLKRAAQAIGIVLVVAFLSFVMFQFVGDPIEGMISENATQQERDELRESLGLNDGVIVQYTRFVKNMAQGNFGISYYNKSDVLSLIIERLPATLELVFVAVVISLVVGILLGVWSAYSRNGLMKNTVQILSLVGVSLPSFVAGILLIVVFSVWLKWLPSHGRGEIVEFGYWSSGLLTLSGLKAVLLPAISLSLFMITMIMRLLKSEIQETMRADYIRFAKARGISERSIKYKHVLKNSILPVVTIIGLQVGGLIAFAVVTETIFQWPGMGLLFIQAVNYVDIPVISAYLVIVAIMFVVINTFVDLIYLLVDPRIKVS